MATELPPGPMATDHEHMISSTNTTEFSLKAFDRKRRREEGSSQCEKRSCEEGLSWWTCLLLGMPQENTKIHPINVVVRK